MVNDLIRLADKLDRLGRTDLSDDVDTMIKAAMKFDPFGEADEQSDESRGAENAESEDDVTAELSEQLAGYIVAGAPFLARDEQGRGGMIKDVSDILRESPMLISEIVRVLEDGPQLEEADLHSIGESDEVSVSDDIIIGPRSDDVGLEYIWPIHYLHGSAELKMEEAGHSPGNIFSASEPRPADGIHSVTIKIDKESFAAKAFLWTRDGSPAGLIVLSDDEAALETAEDSYSSEVMP